MRVEVILLSCVVFASVFDSRTQKLTKIPSNFQKSSLRIRFFGGKILNLI